MVARIRPDRELAIIFQRDGEDPQSRIAPNGERATASALMLLVQNAPACDGDKLSVSYYDET